MCQRCPTRSSAEARYLNAILIRCAGHFAAVDFTTTWSESWDVGDLLVEARPADLLAHPQTQLCLANLWWPLLAYLNPTALCGPFTSFMIIATRHC